MIRLEMNKKQEMILAAIIVVAALAAFVIHSGMLRRPEPPPEPEPPPPTLLEMVSAQHGNMSAAAESLMAALEGGEYTPENPLVVVNPYGTSPLTALIMFTTENPSRVSLFVHGRTEDVSIAHTFESFDTTHIIPAYGLYPGAVNLVEFTMEYEGVTSRLFEYRLVIETDGIEAGITDELITSVGAAPAGSPEFYFASMNNMRAFDTNGDLRWLYLGHTTSYPTRHLDNGNILMIAGSLDAGDAVLLELDLLGRIVSYQPAGPDDEPDGGSANRVELRTLYR